MKSLSKLKKELDKYFSLYIRISNSDENGIAECFTCHKKDLYKNLQNGHFQSRKFLATRFDLQNCQVQCAGCNVFRYGEQYRFAVNLDAKYGEGTAEKLEIQARQSVKITRGEYIDFISYYKSIVKNLLKDKTIL